MPDENREDQNMAVNVGDRESSRCQKLVKLESNFRKFDHTCYTCALKKANVGQGIFFYLI